MKDNKKAYIKVTHDDPVKAREMAETLSDFAKTISNLVGEDPTEVKILEEEPKPFILQEHEDNLGNENTNG